MKTRALLEFQGYVEPYCFKVKSTVCILGADCKDKWIYLQGVFVKIGDFFIVNFKGFLLWNS